jgi:hypothetical protein
MPRIVSIPDVAEHSPAEVRRRTGNHVLRDASYRRLRIRVNSEPDADPRNALEQ